MGEHDVADYGKYDTHGAGAYSMGGKCTQAYGRMRETDKESERHNTEKDAE